MRFRCPTVVQAKAPEFRLPSNDGKLVLEKGALEAAARALMGAPELLIADEPTSSLDTDRRELFVKLLFSECREVGATLIFVSHDRDFVASLATRIIEITPGKIIDYSGTYDEYLRSQGLVESTRAA